MSLALPGLYSCTSRALSAALLVALRLAHTATDEALCGTAAKPAARVKRKRDEANDGGGQECEGATSQPLWRVNFEEFNCRLRYPASLLMGRICVAIPDWLLGGAEGTHATWLAALHVRQQKSAVMERADHELLISSFLPASTKASAANMTD